MNDRGLKLTPADMLKGYLLANIEDGDRRNTANDVWRRRMRTLSDFGEDAGSDFLKNWLRSQYATKSASARSQPGARTGTRSELSSTAGSAVTTNASDWPTVPISMTSSSGIWSSTDTSTDGS